MYRWKLLSFMVSYLNNNYVFKRGSDLILFRWERMVNLCCNSFSIIFPWKSLESCRINDRLGYILPWIKWWYFYKNSILDSVSWNFNNSFALLDSSFFCFSNEDNWCIIFDVFFFKSSNYLVIWSILSCLILSSLVFYLIYSSCFLFSYFASFNYCYNLTF